MALKFQSVLFLLTLLVPFVLSDVSAAGGSRKAADLRGWKPIKNLKSPEVQELARFAIAEHNKKANANLEFHSVVRGETQAVSGKNYWLIIEAKDGAVSGKYDAIVWVKTREHYKHLKSFKLYGGY